MTIDAIEILYKIRKLTSYINKKSRIFKRSGAYSFHFSPGYASADYV